MITIIIGISALLAGLGMGYWFADFTKIRDLLIREAQLKAKCEKLKALVDYYENKDKENDYEK